MKPEASSIEADSSPVLVLSNRAPIEQEQLAAARADCHLERSFCVHVLAIGIWQIACILDRPEARRCPKRPTAYVGVW